jgi:hypothetical protein
MKEKHTKFQNIWLVPYQIHHKVYLGSLKLKTFEGDEDELPFNGQSLK